ncbi:glycosyltransferase [Actinospongicola halichondriae]|uniref:glycosyltransferase n=1 Tax=Actinospongicola halichondriae TaxID=3236844 RepID=UPI003D3A7D39
MAAQTSAQIPRIVHFVFGLREQDEPFHLVHYLAIASCAAVVEPVEIHLHCHHLPYGFYWDLARRLVTLHRIERPAIAAHAYDDAVVARYSYAHEADVIRLDVLAEHGGMYADIDTLFVHTPPASLWDEDCVIGREKDVVDQRTGVERTSVSNALIMARPGSAFVREWRAQIEAAFDGSWSAHSCLLADDLAQARPDQVRVEPERTFHHFPPTPGGLRRLLVDCEDRLDGIVSIHLAAHLWWEERRVDFVREVHAREIDEDWVRSRSTTYALAAAPFLPDHGLF